MAVSTFAEGNHTVTTTEWSLAGGTTGPTVQTTAGVFQAYMDLNALAAGDVFTFKVYEKIRSSGTQRVLFSVPLVGAQTNPGFTFPMLGLINGWDFTVIKNSGTDRSINYGVIQVG